MSSFELNRRHLQGLSIYLFNLKKSAAEAHRLLVETYDEAALSERSFCEWFQIFKNGEFDIEDPVVDCQIPAFVQCWMYNRPNLIPTVEVIIFRQWIYKVYPVSIQPRQSNVKYQRLYNVGFTTGPTFFRLWKKLFSDSKCTRSTQCLIDSDN